MIDTVLQNIIKEKIAKIDDLDNAMIVLKGIPLSVVDPENCGKIELSEIMKDKMKYFIENIYHKRTVITYEEFLILSNFIIDQYKKVYILNNNIYIEQYPIEECFTKEVREGVLNHFGEEDNDEQVIGDITEYIALYNGIKEFKGYLLGAYCDQRIEERIDNIKVFKINIFDNYAENIENADNEINDYIDVIEEADYIDMIKVLFNGPDELYVRTTNYTGDINRLNDHIRLISYYWKDYTDIYFVQPKKVKDSFVHKEEFNEILKKYWGHDSFRTLSVYDMQKLEEGEKEIIEVSQENIISDLVEQVENCEEVEKDYRDLFVTAPTGAGKSAMFQIPAIYLAEKYNLLTIVISPLIGLMNDQVNNLELKNYKYAKTINSDISPIIKQEIIDRVSEGEYHILYLSPETLLSRSDIEQLIGNRTIGMIVIDEAHIVTTWGKQFRPDYWYLGDRIKKIRKDQIKNKGRSFVVATFTATAIYHGVEDMYNETINSLQMIDPITYLGYVKRNDITINIKKMPKPKDSRTEYELDKFEQIENIIKRVKITNKKTLIYFPTVSLIERCYDYFKNKKMIENVAIYHGSLEKEKKTENYEKFYSGEKLIMLATKAFGMGIDIDNIEIVYHFAPTGNVCDYVQEIGRAARRKELTGEGLYHYDSRDFKHINKLHGISSIQRYQLIEVVKKICELYQSKLQKNGSKEFTKKRNSMLLDAENFTYIFKSPISDEDNDINKVKTALLMIQKDFENRIGFSPINVKPIPLFAIGFFKIDKSTQARLLKQYPDCLEEIEKEKNICRVMLDKIWEKDYKSVSFPKFKFLLYSKSDELELNKQYDLKSTLCVDINYGNDYYSQFKNIWDVLKKFIHQKVISSEHTGVAEIANALEENCKGIGKYKARTICEVIISSMDIYRKKINKGLTQIAQEKVTVGGKIKYQFRNAVNSYFNWVEICFQKILKETKNGNLYLVNDAGTKTKEYAVVLGILEAMNVISFEMIGGANSQLYIYVNQIQAMKNILNAPYNYKNRLLEVVSQRHLISVKMLTYIYENDFTNEERWDLLEDYFLGKIPEKVKHDCKKENPEMSFE